MASKTKTAPQETGLIKWNEELAALANEGMKAVEGIGGGKFISIREGKMKVDGAEVPGNQLACVIIDHVRLNTFFSGAYDEDNPAPPSCYAFGNTEDEMGPHDDCPHKEHAQCVGCPNNEYGTATKANGAAAKGKACKNKFRLAIIPAGTLNGGEFDPASFQDLKSASIFFLDVPPTSLKEYAGHVKSVKNALMRPVWSIFTKLICAGGQTNPLRFEPIEKIDDGDILGMLKERHFEATKAIQFPFPKPEAKAPKAAPAKRGKGGRY